MNQAEASAHCVVCTGQYILSLILNFHLRTLQEGGNALKFVCAMFLMNFSFFYLFDLEEGCASTKGREIFEKRKRSKKKKKKKVDYC